MGSAHDTDRDAARETARLRHRLAEAEAEAARADASLEERTRELEARTRELDQRTGELDRSRARFQDVIERNPDAILVVDADGVIRFANPRAAELFRTPSEELVGTTFGFPMVAGETTELDLLHDGGARIVEMRVVESEWDREDACIASLRDVTERRHAEESARRLIREQAARSAAEAAADRFRFLAEASRLLSTPLDYEETLRILGRLCVDQIADWAIIYVVDEQGVGGGGGGGSHDT
jgi:PAS domain-containing protein